MSPRRETFWIVSNYGELKSSNDEKIYIFTSSCIKQVFNTKASVFFAYENYTRKV